MCDSGKCPRAIWGHFKYFGIHKFIHKPYYYFTVLRDPVARFVSFYNHQRSKPSAKWHDRVQQEKLSVIDLLDSSLFQYHNHYVRWLTGNLMGDLSFADLQNARRILNQFNLVGFTDRFNELFFYLKNRFNWQTEQYQNYYVRNSVKLFEKLTFREKRAIADVNWMDCILYEETRKKWQQFWDEHTG